MKAKSEIIEIARSWVGTPWKHNQRRKGIGVDCINFLYAIAVESDYNIEPIPSNYARLPLKDEIKQYLMRNFALKKSSALGVCDIVLLKSSGSLCHVALTTEKGKIIHANQKLGKVVEHYFDGIWLRMVDSVYYLSNIK